MQYWKCFWGTWYSLHLHFMKQTINSTVLATEWPLGNCACYWWKLPTPWFAGLADWFPGLALIADWLGEAAGSKYSLMGSTWSIHISSEAKFACESQVLICSHKARAHCVVPCRPVFTAETYGRVVRRILSVPVYQFTDNTQFHRWRSSCNCPVTAEIMLHAWTQLAATFSQKLRTPSRLHHSAFQTWKTYYDELWLAAINMCQACQMIKKPSHWKSRLGMFCFISGGGPGSN